MPALDPSEGFYVGDYVPAYTPSDGTTGAADCDV